MRQSKWLKAYQMAPQYIPNTLAEKPLSVRGSLGPVPRELANVETEGGETVFLPDKDGLPAHYKIHGPRHYQGGVPMNIPPDSFVFSDTASMRIRDKAIQKDFGMPETKRGYTPAEIAKKYDINKYRKILQDPNSDRLQISTAESIIANYQVKLGKLALIQESMKGFPAGIPMIALPFLAKYNLDPEMVLPTELNQQQPPMGEMPMARYGGMPMYLVGGPNNEPTATPEQQEQLQFLPSARQRRRMEKKAERDARRNYMTELYIKELQKLFAYDDTPSDDGDASDGMFYREDENGNPYYVDSRGVRIKSFDDNYYGPNNTPTEKSKRIVETNNKRYEVEVSNVPASKIDKTKLKNSKSEAVNEGDIYIEHGKYYQVGELDRNKPIRATKSGQNILEGNFEDHKKRATEILEKLQKEGAAVYHPTDYTVGGVPRKAGWEIKASAKQKLTTAEKEFLTDFFSIGNTSGQIGLGTPEFNVSLQESGGTGFYGYTDPDFYEYRYWRARNQTKKAEDWAQATPEEKKKNRVNYLYSLGFDTNDPHIKDNLDNPEKLYSKEFVEGRKKVKLNRAIVNTDTKEAMVDAGLTDAVRAYFKPEDFRPGLPGSNKLGLEHADAFSFDRPVTEITDTVENTPEKEVERIEKKNDPYYTAARKYSPWWLQDVIAVQGAAQDLFSIRKYKPYKAQYTPYVPSPTFYDPAREIAAIQETAGMASDVMRGMGTSTQSMGARLAQIQGTAAENIANTMGKYNNLNIGVANEFAYKQADIINEAQLKNQQFTKQYIDEFNTLNQNYDNAKRAARGNLRNAYIQGITNKANAQVLNTLYPNYQIDPSTGGMLSFYKGLEMEAQENAGHNLSSANAFMDWFKSQGLDKTKVDMGDAYKVWSGTTDNLSKQQKMNNAYLNAYQSRLPQGMDPQYNFTQPTDQSQDYKRGGAYPFTYTVGYFK